MFQQAGTEVQSRVHREDGAQEGAEAYWYGSDILSSKSIASVGSRASGVKGATEATAQQ